MADSTGFWLPGKGLQYNTALASLESLSDIVRHCFCLTFILNSGLIFSQSFVTINGTRARQVTLVLFRNAKKGLLTFLHKLEKRNGDR